jgi:hypothetical protein
MTDWQLFPYLLRFGNTDLPAGFPALPAPNRQSPDRT